MTGRTPRARPGAHSSPNRNRPTHRDSSQPDPQSGDGGQESAGAQPAGQAGSEQSSSDQQPGEAPEDGAQPGQNGGNDDQSAPDDGAPRADGQSGQGGEKTGDGTDSSPPSESPTSSASGGTPDADSSAAPQPRPGGEGTPQDSRQQPLHDGEVFERALEHLERTGRSSPAPKTEATGDASPQSRRDQDPASRDDAGPTDPVSDSRPDSRDQTGDRAAQPHPTAADQPAQSPSEPSGDARQPTPSRSHPPDSAAGPDDRPSPSESEGGEPKPDRAEGDQPRSGTDLKDTAGGDRSGDPSAPQPDPSRSGTEPTLSNGSERPDPADTDDSSPSSSDPKREPARIRVPTATRERPRIGAAGRPRNRRPNRTAHRTRMRPPRRTLRPRTPARILTAARRPTSPIHREIQCPPGRANRRVTRRIPGGRKSPRPAIRRGARTGGLPQGDSLPDESTTPPIDRPSELAEADAVNLEYARQATQLVLERLKDEQQKPDPELLESLGWTADELNQFIARWESLKRAAQEDRVRGQADLDDALRSLGLRATGPERRRVGAQADRIPGLRDQSRSRPPAAFLEPYNAYKRGAARGQQEGGHESP